MVSQMNSYAVRMFVILTRYSASPLAVPEAVGFCFFFFPPFDFPSSRVGGGVRGHVSPWQPLELKS